MKPLSEVTSDCLIQLFGIDKPWLAPLAGYSDLPFRLLCREYGSSCAVTEMISAKGLVYGTPATTSIIATCPEDQPLVAQIFGSEPRILKEAIHILRKKGFRFFDFNVGCPVRKVFRQHSGAALLADLPLLKECARNILEAVREEMPDCPPAFAGFKLRAGIKPEKPVLMEAALMLEDLGADWLAAHPRFASHGYSGKANWELISMLAHRLSIPLLASGDLFNAEKGLACLAETGASGLMYARGALYNPAIFRDHALLLKGEKPEAQTLNTILSIIKRHIAFTRKYDVTRRGFIKMRSVVPRYVRQMRGAQDIRVQICKCGNWEELLLLLDTLPESFK